MANLTYPGVYIEEFTPGAPIQGVGTNVAALLGPLEQGDPNDPVKITSWDAFKSRYGNKPPAVEPYLWYGVRGFFENGGTVCYVLRVSTAAAATTGPIDDMSGKHTIVVRAVKTGVLAGYSVDVDDDIHAVTGRTLSRPTAAGSNGAGDKIVTASAADAGKFVPGDRLAWNAMPANEKPVVRRVEGDTLRLQEPLTAPANNVSVGLAPLVKDETQDFRVDDATDLEPGTVLKLSQAAPGGADSTAIVDYVTEVPLPAGGTTQRVQLRTKVKENYALTKDVTLDSTEFKLTINGPGGATYVCDDLSMDSSHPHYFPKVVESVTGGLFTAESVQPPSSSAPPLNRPKTKANIAIGGGADDNPGALTAANYRDALERLRAIDDVNMVATPGRTDKAVQQALIGHCEEMWDRVAILDSRPGDQLFGAQSVEEQRGGLSSSSGFAALYYPWIEISADGPGTLRVPPSGHVAGVYARTDDLRGVHKAPAGEEAALRGALGVETTMSDIDQGQLNLQGIDVIRSFRPGGQPYIWGARTIASDLSWAYLNIRRLFLYLEESIQEGIRWALFEPNNTQLWKKLNRTITAFLTAAWRDGALFGDTADAAFYVRIDEALNPFSEQQLGRLHIEIGCRPSYPAEFIVVRIGIWPGGGSVSES